MSTEVPTIGAILRCPVCHFFSYDLSERAHGWFYSTTLGSVTDEVIEHLCPVCKELQHLEQGAGS